MPYPTPHITNISLLAEVPLDATYRHTLYFASAAAQHTYFAGKVVSGLVWTECVYHREQSAIRVNAPIEDVERVNYVMFQNTAYSSKWFYAFVTDCVYINANCTELKIELDVLQTWYFDVQLMPSYIERAHAETDAIGDNLVEETIDIGDPVVLNSLSSNQNVFKRWDVIALTTFDWSTWQPAAGGVYNGVYSALNRTRIGQFDISMLQNALQWTIISDPRSKLVDLITNHADLVDGLVAVFMAPTSLEIESGSMVHLGITKPAIGDRLKPLNATDGYIPRNHKLYTSPFTKLFVTDGAGGGKFYAYEKFASGSQADFMITSDRAPAQSVLCIPAGYNGYKQYLAGSDEYNFEESVVMTGLPQCAWISSSYQTYLAQNASQLGLSQAMAYGKTAIGGLGVALSVAGALPSAGATLAGAGAGASMFTSGLSEIINLNADKQDRARRAPEMHGQMTGTALFSAAEKAFRFITYCPRPEYCEIIDNFFDLYGYAQHRVYVPNLNARPHWTYIKTVGALVLPASNTGGVNAGVLQQIEAIYNRGITYWRNAAEVGNYSLDNSI